MKMKIVRELNWFLLSIACLVVILSYGWLTADEPEYDLPLKQLLGGKYSPAEYDALAINKDMPLLFKVCPKGGKDVETYICIGEGDGYGGPVITVSAVDPGDYVITKTMIIDHQEWPAWIAKIEQADLIGGLKGRKITDGFILGQDIDGVTGATISSRGIIRSAREAVHSLAETELGLTPQKAPFMAGVGVKELIVLVILGISILCTVTSKVKLRRPVLFSSAMVLGFWLAIPLTIGKISCLFLGRFPHLEDNILWYLMVFVIIIGTLILRKNFYCFWLCPFGAIQEFLSLSGIHLPRPSKWVARLGSFLPNILLFTGLVIIFSTCSPLQGSYEPFSTAFAFEGGTFRWLLLSFSLLTGLFITRFWCRFFCPVGCFLKTSLKLIRLPNGKPKDKKKAASQECNSGNLKKIDLVYLFLYVVGLALVFLVILEVSCRL